MNIKLDALKIVNVLKITGEEWLKYRQTGIGGSDAAAIAGVNKYKSKLSAFLDKVNPIVSYDSPSEAAEMGHIMEPVIRKVFKDRNPDYKVYQSNFMWRSEEHPFMLANVDGLIYDKERGWGILEIKNMSEYRLDEFGEEQIPIEFIIQSHHYMATLKLNYCIFAVFIGGNKYREFFVKRDESVIEYLIQLERSFWEENVMKNVAPEPDGSESSGEALKQLYSKGLDKERVLDLPSDTKELTQAYEFYSQQETEMKKKKEAIKQQLQALLGEYQTAQIEGDSKKVRWTFSKKFREDVFKEKNPELYAKFVKPTLDAQAFKKAYPSLYKEFMTESGSRTFSYK